MRRSPRGAANWRNPLDHLDGPLIRLLRAQRISDDKRDAVYPEPLRHESLLSSDIVPNVNCGKTHVIERSRSIPTGGPGSARGSRGRGRWERGRRAAQLLWAAAVAEDREQIAREVHGHAARGFPCEPEVVIGRLRVRHGVRHADVGVDGRLVCHEAGGGRER